jgi:hypothetical protein
MPPYVSPPRPRLSAVRHADLVEVGEGLTVRNLLISGVVLLLAYAAFDDIMTDNATSFLPEYAILGVAAVWFAWLGMTTLRRRWRHA